MKPTRISWFMWSALFHVYLDLHFWGVPRVDFLKGFRDAVPKKWKPQNAPKRTWISIISPKDTLDIQGYILRRCFFRDVVGFRRCLDVYRDRSSETNNSHLKMDGWKTLFLFGSFPIFRGELLVRGRVCMSVLGDGSKYVFLFSSLFGELIPFDDHIFQTGWNHQLVLICLSLTTAN